VKNRIRKLCVSVLALLMAIMMGTSCAFEVPSTEGNKRPGNHVDYTDTVVTPENNGITKLPEEFASQIYNNDYINQAYLDSASPETLNLRSNGKRRIIVELESASQLDLYLEDAGLQTSFGDFTSYVNASAGKAYAKSLVNEHNAFIKLLNYGKFEYTIRHTYTSILNGVAIEVADEDVAAISRLAGIKNVIYSEAYSIPTVEPTINVVDVYGTGIYDASDLGYKGDGMLVAVLDTGFDIAHKAFSTMPEVEKVTYEDVEAVFDDLTAATYGTAITAEDVYYNAKVPFAYDYADGDPDVFAISNSHGVHVAGIIAGQDDTVTPDQAEAFENGEKFLGVAPNAQLFIGKVFPDTDDGQDNGAETDDILAALADCVTVGTDVINMSLGTSCGFSRDVDASATNVIYDKIYAAGINLVVAASNSYSSALNGAYGSTNLTSNPDSATVGSPSTYVGALSVASISGQKSSYMLLDDGTAVYFNESSNAASVQGDFVAEILNGASSKTLNYVVVPGFGKTSNYTATVREELAKGNCIAVVSRGDISFEEKQKNAFDNGAVACIIYNNVSGKISASLGTGKKIPTCTVTAAIGQRLVANGTGTITLDQTFKAGPFMSDFSSWGPTPDLKIKPEITAHGGEITSAVVGGYDQYSGTSMASPNMAGAVTLLRQHVSEKYGLTGTALSDRVNQLLMSTATIVYDQNGKPYSIRKQGAGLGDIGKSIATDAYLYVKNNSKPKLELGDDPNKTGVYVMEFCVSNTGSKAKTYNLDIVAMTESVSIDGITVEEVAYMLTNAQKNYYVNGQATGGTVTVNAGEDVTVRAVLALSTEEKNYLDANFANGMYVEGFVTLDDADAKGVDLSIPYLAFYGDWNDAPIFDYTAYDVSKDYYDSSIPDEDKVVSAVYETVAIGRYYRGVDYYLPLGQYIYNLPEGVDSGVVSSVDKIAVGNDDYGIYEMYAVYFGMLRGAGEMTVSVENAVTGEVILSETQYNIRKAYTGIPTFSLLELSPYEMGLSNNEKYNMVFEAKIDYDDGEDKIERQEFSFYVDYQAPTIYGATFRYEEQEGGDRRVFMDVELYDNHYVQSVQIFSLVDSNAIDWMNDYAIPVTNSQRDSLCTVSLDITDWMDNFADGYGQYANCVGIRMDDYALNSGAYVIPITGTTVDAITVNYTYDDENGDEVVKSVAGETIVLRPGQAIDLSEDSAIISTKDGEFEADLSISMIGYTAYACTNPDAHGLACGYVYNERNGLIYEKGDYYYDAATGEVKQKEADDEEATYAPNTLFSSVIAEEVVKNGNRYEKPESKHFVCPKCGKEETFTFNTRTGKITTKLFEKLTQDPMVEDVIWSSSNTKVVKVENGKLYAVGEGQTNITAYAVATVDYNTFNFSVRVEGDPVTNYIEKITVGQYYNRNTGLTRSVSGGYALVECGSTLDLYPDFEPWYVTAISDLKWQSSDPTVAEIVTSSSKSARVVCKKPGTVNILMSSPSNGIIGSFTLAIDEEYTLYSYYFHEYNGVGYSEMYTDENGKERKMLVIPANLGIINIGHYNTGVEGPFVNNTTLDTVVVPEGVTTIGIYCFAGSSIKRLYLPSTIEAISYYAFYMSDIQEILWYDASENSNSGIVYDADKNTYNWDKFFANASEKCTAKRLGIGSNAFCYAYDLKTFDLSKATAIYGRAFSYTALEYADLSSVRFAGTYIFAYCSELKDVTLSADTAVNGYMFNGSAIEKIDFYGSNIPDYLFYNATSLTEVVIHNDVAIAGSRAFSNCSALTSVVFEGTCGMIGASTFEGCSALATFTIPEGVTLIGARAFANCTSLITLSVDPYSNIQDVGLNVFIGSNALKQINIAGSGSSRYYNTVSYDNGNHKMLTDRKGTKIILCPPTYELSAPEGVFYVPLKASDDLTGQVNAIGAQAYANNASLNGKEVVIPEGITKIGFAAFQGTGITKVVIPSTVTDIDQYAFYGCTKLETVVMLCDIEYIPARMFSTCSALNYIQIPSSVQAIGEYAFSGTGIKSITIGENVEYIGVGAFSSCRSLAEINFAKQSKLEVIDSSAFRYCTAVETIELPDTVLAMGDYVFANCTALLEVYVSAGLEYMGAYVFTNDLALTKFEMGYGALMLGDYAFFTPYGTSGFYYQQYLRDVTIPETCEYIGAYAFAGNTVLDTIDITGVTYLAEGAFYYTSALTDVIIDDRMYYIGPGAFMSSAIENIDLSVVELFDTQCFYGTNVKAGEFTNALLIASGAFYNCFNIEEVNLPNVQIIYSSAFFTSMSIDGVEVRGSIKKVTFGPYLMGLGGGAFFNSQITEVHLPASVEVIGAPAFAGCYELEKITVDSRNEIFFVDPEYGGLYMNLPNGTYELVAVPNALRYDVVAENYEDLVPYRILEGTSRIGSWAMGYCKYIHAVEIPASVKTIGSYGFYFMGMGLIEEATEEDVANGRAIYPKYIFKGLQAPALESEFDSSTNSLTDLYANFSYPIGYLINDMIIPVNAQGFESVLYEYFFMEKEYSEEIIEDDTKMLIEWLDALDLNKLTLAEEVTVNEMNMIYFMMSAGQKAFLTEEHVAKLNAAVEKIAQLKEEAEGEQATPASYTYNANATVEGDYSLTEQA